MKANIINRDILFVDDFWPTQKCKDFIVRSEAQGYQPATISTEHGPRVIDHIRNNNRVLFTDQNLADALWQESRTIVPAQFGKSRAIGINEFFRFYRYEPGQQFRKHRDGSFIRNEREASYYTLMIYLNDDFKGGETSFADVTIKPREGSMLIFNHQLEHAGNPVVEGVKYVLRTDIMYKLME